MFIFILQNKRYLNLNCQRWMRHELMCYGRLERRKRRESAFKYPV